MSQNGCVLELFKLGQVGYRERIRIGTILFLLSSPWIPSTSLFPVSFAEKDTALSRSREKTGPRPDLSVNPGDEVNQKAEAGPPRPGGQREGGMLLWKTERQCDPLRHCP